MPRGNAIGYCPRSGPTLQPVHDWITFGLAFLGYAALAADAVRRAAGARSPGPTRLAAAIVLAHVLCVWAFRFDWSLQAMLAKGLGAFALFHGAFAAILAAVLVREPWRSRLVLAAFAVVSLGAVPAPFRYDEIAVLRLPMLAAFGAALAAMVRWRPRGAAMPPAASPAAAPRTR